MRVMGMVMLFAVNFLPVLAVSCVHLTLTPRQDALRRRIVDALDIAHISHKHAAITMKVSEQRLSEVLNGRAHLSILRFADLPDEFWAALEQLGVESRDGTVLYRPELVRMVRGLGFLMARMEVLAEHDQQPQQKRVVG